MEHVYLNTFKVFRTLILLGTFALATTSFAQNSTNVGTSTNCGVIRENFDLGNGGYTSPSVYADSRSDSAFYYNSSRGFWTEMGEVGRERAVAPAVPRFVSIVSPAYNSPSTAGNFDVGFVYIVPNPSADRFNVSLVRLTTVATAGGLDETIAEVVARSSFQTFAAFSRVAPTPYTDPNPLQSGQRGAVCIRLIDQDITVGPNVRYRVEVSYQILTGGSFTAFDDFSLNNSQQSPLPVNFMGIVAKRNNNAVEVRWDIADEVNVKEYQVEKSMNGRSFSTVGSVSATGSSVYGYTDGAAGTGTILYRVKSVDLDGKTKFSSVVRIKGANSYATQLKLYPLPARNQVTIEHRQLGANARISINTMDGKMLKQVIPTNGASHTPVELGGMAPGMYIVRVDDGTGGVETIKLIKQ